MYGPCRLTQINDDDDDDEVNLRFSSLRVYCVCIYGNIYGLFLLLSSYLQILNNESEHNSCG